MSRDFKKAKSITKYLEGRYGKIKKYNIEDDIQFAKDLEKDHSLEELIMMKKRLDASISLHKDTSYTASPEFSIILIPITAAIAISTKFTDNIADAAILIVMEALVVIIGVFILSKGIKSFLRKMYSYSILINEAIDIKEKYDKGKSDSE